MATEKNMTEAKDHSFRYQLKDFSGVVVFEWQMSTPLQFPYLFWNDKLFVSSRDEIGTLLERSFHVMMPDAPDERH